KLKGVVTSGDKRGTKKVVAVSGSGIVMDLVKCDKLKGGETSGDEMRTDKVVEVRGTEKVVAVSGSEKVVEVSGSGKVVEASGSGKVMDLVKMFENMMNLTKSDDETENEKWTRTSEADCVC
nr:hypothetical protein [Tanacetum cinerariifolium]